MRRFERMRDVQMRTGLSRSEIYRRIAAGTFPPQIKIGIKAVGWVSEEVDAWIDARILETERLQKQWIAMRANSRNPSVPA